MNRPELIDQCRYRWHDILTMLGIDKNYLVNRHGPCPICEGRDRFRFDNKNGNGEYYCNSCGAGNGATLAMKYLGLSFKEVAQTIREIIGECRMTETTPIDTEETLRKNTERLKKIHSGLKKITSDDAAGKYFISRGITVLPCNDCFFHPGIGYWIDGVNQGNYPSIVSVFRNSDEKTSSYHVTYLTDQGKYDRKIMPTILPLNGCAIKLFPAGEVLSIAEGIESALSVHQETGYPCWAAGNSGLMEKVAIPTEVRHVFIYADSEPSFTGLKSAFVLANRIAGKHETVTVVSLVHGQQVFHEGDNFDMNDWIKLDDSGLIASHGHPSEFYILEKNSYGK